MALKLDLHIDENGDTMATLHNKEVFDRLIIKLGIEEVMDKYHDEYISYTKKAMFDPRKSNMVFRTEAQAKQAQIYGAKLNALDQKYLEKAPPKLVVLTDYNLIVKDGNAESLIPLENISGVMRHPLQADTLIIWLNKENQSEIIAKVANADKLINQITSLVAKHR